MYIQVKHLGIITQLGDKAWMSNCSSSCRWWPVNIVLRDTISDRQFYHSCYSKISRHLRAAALGVKIMLLIWSLKGSHLCFYEMVKLIWVGHSASQSTSFLYSSILRCRDTFMTATNLNKNKMVLSVLRIGQCFFDVAFFCDTYLFKEAMAISYQLFNSVDARKCSRPPPGLRIKTKIFLNVKCYTP